MTSNRDGANTQCNRIDRGEFFRRLITRSNEITIFFHVSGQLVRGRNIRTHLCLAGDDDNIAPEPIAIKIESYPGILLHMREASGICPAIYEDCGCRIIPQQPDMRRLSCALRVNGSEPD